MKTNTVSDKVVVVTPIYDAFPEIISSLICQTHTNWELLLIDDNQSSKRTQNIVATVNDNRIKHIPRPRFDAKMYGHPHRQWALQQMKKDRLATDANYVLITNADNYYLPNYLTAMIAGFANPNIIATYCASMLHSYVSWKLISCRLALGHIDCGGVIIRKEVACDTGWRSFEHSSDWTYFSDILLKHPSPKWAKIEGTLFVHN